jgi:hypothetical protein
LVFLRQTPYVAVVVFRAGVRTLMLLSSEAVRLADRLTPVANSPPATSRSTFRLPETFQAIETVPETVAVKVDVATWEVPL